MTAASRTKVAEEPAISVATVPPVSYTRHSRAGPSSCICKNSQTTGTQARLHQTLTQPLLCDGLDFRGCAYSSCPRGAYSLGRGSRGKTIHKVDTYNTVGEANQEAGGGAQGVVTVDRVVRHDLKGTSLGGDEESTLWISGQEHSRQKKQQGHIASEEPKRARKD